MEGQPMAAKDKIKRNAVSVLTWLKKNLRAVLAVTGVASGVAVGFVFRESLPSEDRLQLLLATPGDLLLRMLRMLTLPMTVSSAVTASSQFRTLLAAKMVGRLMTFHLTTSLAAAMIGAATAGIVHPGSPGVIAASGFYIHDSSYWLHLFFDFFRNAVPENLVQASFQHSRTVPYPGIVIPIENITEQEDPLEEDESYVWKTEYRPGLSLLGIALTSTTFGAMCYLSDNPFAEVMVRLLSVLNRIMLKMADLIMWYFPVGVAFLITADILLSRDSSLAASQVALLVIAMGVATAIHSCLLVPLAYWFLTGRNPFLLFRNVFYALVVAFGSSSSIVCLPITVRCMDEHEGSDKRINRVLLPLGAAICLDGAAIYGAVAGIFLLQMNDVSLGVGHFLYIGLAAFVLSFASPLLPLHGVIYLAQLLTAYVDVHHWMLIVSADWIITRLRSLANAWSSVIGAATVGHLSLAEDDWSAECLVREEEDCVDGAVPGCSSTTTSV